MVKLINGRPPKAIKIGLRNMLETCADACGVDDILCHEMCCPYDGDGNCHETILMDALVLIQQLESERDAAINCLQDESNCAGCKWDSEYNDPKSPCLFCKRGWEDETEDHYAWRGTEPPEEDE